MKNLKFLSILALVFFLSSCGDAVKTAQQLADDFANANANDNNGEPRDLGENPLSPRDDNGFGEPTFPDNGPDPISNQVDPAKLAIVNFSVDENEFIEGQSLTLSWEVNGASNVIIRSSDYNVFVYVDASGELEIRPQSSLVYTLKATNFANTISESIKVDLIEEEINVNVGGNQEGPSVVGNGRNNGNGGVDVPGIPEVDGGNEGNGLNGDDNPPAIPDGGVDDPVANDDGSDQVPDNSNSREDDVVPGVVDSGVPGMPEVRRDPVDLGSNDPVSIPVGNIRDDINVVDFRANCADINANRLEDAIDFSLTNDFVVAGDSVEINWETNDILDPLPTITITNQNTGSTYRTNALQDNYNDNPRVSTTYDITVSYCSGKTVINHSFEIPVWSFSENEINLPNNLELAKIIPASEDGFYITADYQEGNIRRDVVFQTGDLSLDVSDWELARDSSRDGRFAHQYLEGLGGSVEYRHQHESFSAVLRQPAGCPTMNYYGFEGYIYRTQRVRYEDGSYGELPLGPTPNRDRNNLGNDDLGTIVEFAYQGQFSTPEFIFTDPYFPEVLYIGGRGDRIIKLANCNQVEVEEVIDPNMAIFNDHRSTDYVVLGDEIVVISGGRLIRGQINFRNQRVWSRLDRANNDYEWLTKSSDYILAGRENSLFTLKVERNNIVQRSIRIDNLAKAIQLNIPSSQGELKSMIIALLNDGSLQLSENGGFSFRELNLPVGFRGEITDLYQGSDLNKIWLIDSRGSGLELKLNN
jgi:hypothetical protein